jgi:undecaprenyl-diphosphatase
VTAVTSRARGHWPLVFFGLFAPLLAFATLSSAVESRDHIEWDSDVIGVLSRHGPALPMGDAILGASTYALAALGVVVPLIFLSKRQPRYAAFWALAIGGVLVFDPLLKHAFKRPEPGGTGYSFPSGSAMLSMATVCAIVLLADRWRPAVALAGILGVAGYGVSIVYLEWHYPTDVLAGWSLSAAWVCGLWLALVARPAARERVPAD